MPAEFNKTTLKNGLRIITAPMPQVKSVTVAVFIGTGSRYENKENNGISHFLEHMLFRGTRKYPVQADLARTVEGMGGVWNGGTDKEYTIYWIKVAAQHWQKALDILYEMVQASLLRSRDIEVERGVILEEIGRYKDHPRDYVQVLIDHLTWPKNPLGWDTGGTKEAVSKVKRADFVSYLNNHYTPGNIIVGVAGNFKRSEFIREVRSRFGSLKKNEPPAFVGFKEKQTEPRVLVHHQKPEQTHLCLSLRAYSFDHPDRFAMGLLTAVLGVGMSSRLWQAVREKEGLAYAIYALPHHFHDTGIVQIYAGVDTKRAEKALKAVLDELGKLKSKKVSGKELKKVKEHQKGILALQLEGTSGALEYYGFQELLMPEVLTYEQICKKIDAVSAVDVQRVAREIFVNEKLNLAVIGPFKDKGKFEKILKL